MGGESVEEALVRIIEGRRDALTAMVIRDRLGPAVLRMNRTSTQVTSSAAPWSAYCLPRASGSPTARWTNRQSPMATCARKAHRNLEYLPATPIFRLRWA
jgi:hypothetical protein